MMHAHIGLRISVFSNLLKMLSISTRRDMAVVFTCGWKDDLGADSQQTLSPDPWQKRSIIWNNVNQQEVIHPI